MRNVYVHCLPPNDSADTRVHKISTDISCEVHRTAYNINKIMNQ